MDNNKNIIEFTISGDNITPESISIRELTELLTNLENSITAISQIQSKNKLTDTFTLISIKSGSASYELKYPEQYNDSTRIVLNAISNNKINELLPKCIEGIKKIYEFTKRKICKINIKIKDTEPLEATIDSSMEINEPSSYILQGDTTIYGIVERVGGATGPKVSIRLSNNKTITCSIDENIAKELGKRLYMWVGILGKATWNINDYTIESFDIKGITEYNGGSIIEGFKELSEIAGKYWDGVEAIQTVKKIRSGDY